MKVILVGYEGSKKILSTTSFLYDKYVPKEFEIFYLNFGKFDGELKTGTYVSLDDEQKGGSSSWARYIVEYLRQLEDEFIIFSLDDYLQSSHMNYDAYKNAFNYMKTDKSIGSCKMSIGPSYRLNDYDKIDDKLYLLRKTAGYSATTQMNIWRRDFLIDILSRISSPWQFELDGSAFISSTQTKIIGSLDVVFNYPEPSSISSRHPGQISVLGNKKSDVEECIENGYLDEDELIMGQWVGAVRPYSDCKDDPYGALDACPSGEYDYYKLLLDTCFS
tara:strand:+ start:8210 stop:9037 length:828 start_codon:yes stop_codon:yes gene_type:complete